MEAQFLPREAFADEQSYIAHRQHIASLHRAERLKQTDAQPRLQHPPRIAKLLRLMKRREYDRRWRENNRESVNAYSREWQRRKYWDNPEHRRRLRRDYYRRHPEEQRLYARVYYWDHRDEVLEKGRHQKKARRAARPEYVSRDARHEQALQLEMQIAQLRQQGVSWNDVAKALGKPVSTCRRHYDIHKRRGEKKYLYRDDLNSQQRQELAQQFTLRVVALRQSGLSWAKIADELNRQQSTCTEAYRRYLKRQQQSA